MPKLPFSGAMLPTLAVGLLTVGVLQADAAIGGGGGITTTSTNSTTTVNINHDTTHNLSVQDYETQVLGFSTFTSHVAAHQSEQYDHKQVYDNTIAAAPSSQDVQIAFDEARNAITNDLHIASRGQIHISDPVQISQNTTHNQTSTTNVTATTQTVTIQSTVTGPLNTNTTILVGDNQSSTFVVVAGTENVNTNTNTQNDIYRTITNTDTATTTTAYEIDGSVCESPIVLNMNGSGRLEASNGDWTPHPGTFHWQHRALFDFYGNGFPVAMEWVGPADGLLCRPKSDGKVDGSCLFGTATGFTNGFEQMAALDENMDGRLTGSELNGLCLWQDKNGNARADAGEVKTLKELGITEISVRQKNMKSTFVMKGKTFTLFDWWPTTFQVRKIKRSV